MQSAESESGKSRSDEPPCREVLSRTTLRVAKLPNEKNRLQTTQANELQNRRTRKATANNATQRIAKLPNEKNRSKKQNNYSLSIHPHHYAASGLLNLPTTLTKAVTPVTPGVKLL